MSWPLDPRSWWTLGESVAPAAWLDQWTEATSFWLDPTRSRQSPERLLLDIVEGVAGQFRGRRITLQRADQPVGFTLDGIEIIHRRANHHIEVTASDIDWAGTRIPSARAHAFDVAIEMGATSTLTAATIEIEGQIEASAAVSWLAPFVEARWVLEIGPAGLLEAQRPGRSLAYAVAAQVRHGALVVELRRVTWRSAHVFIPHWLRLARTIRLPALPRGVEVLSAELDEGWVRFRLRLREFREPIELDRLRKAIVNGLGRFSWP